MASVIAEPSKPCQPDVAAVPPLENGDRLTRDEFERRYAAMPYLKKAELIEGVVYMMTIVSYGGHAAPHFDLITWLGLYQMGTPGVEGGDNGSIRLDLDNMPQPDAFLIVRPDLGGQTRVGEDDRLEGAPEFVAEVASSSASYDLHAKKNAYRRNGVREYLVWKTREKAFEWFALHEGEYRRIEPGPTASSGATSSPACGSTPPRSSGETCPPWPGRSNWASPRPSLRRSSIG